MLSPLDLESILFAQKPSGITSHTSTGIPFYQEGFAEYLERKFASKLYVVHRLDRDTSGAMLFARSTEVAARLTEIFSSHQVRKEYLFITDRTTKHLNTAEKRIRAESLIERKGHTYVSEKSSTANSFTEFEKISESGKFSLWKAYPISGKPHQIRLHAQDLGISILGDVEHGGSQFSRLCLHNSKIEIGDSQWTSHAPAYFLDLKLLDDSFLCNYFSAIHRREMLFSDILANENSTESLRLIHTDVDNFRLDLFGKYLWGYWYDDASTQNFSHFEKISKHLKRPICVRSMQNRGKDPNLNQLWFFNSKGDAFPETWVATENRVKYEARTQSGLSPGLFFDQRSNRSWVKNQSSDKRVLNLFAYTGLFSVNAALASPPPKEVTTVDLSANFIDWTKKNFTLNNLDPTQYEFWSQDVFLFLKGAQKRNRQWDLVICDPPSFSRSDKSTKKIFRLEKDLAELLELLLSVIAPKGKLLFTNNYEKWSSSQMLKEIRRALASKAIRNVQILSMPVPDLDYEITQTSEKIDAQIFANENALMKGFVLEKK